MNGGGSVKKPSSRFKPKDVPKRLLEYGENFLRMFDDFDSPDEAEAESDGEEEEERISVEDDGRRSLEPEGSLPDVDDDSKVTGNIKPTTDGGRKVVKEPRVVHDTAFTPGPSVSKKDRRLFMSPRAADVHKVHFSPSTAKEREEDMVVTELFASISQEVEDLGASQLSEKDRKKWEMQKFCELGAKPLKSPKSSIRIGLGMKRSAEKRQLEQRELDIAAGMVQVKGSGKSNQKSRFGGKRQNPEDSGIEASDGKFKNGVLYVQPLAKKQKRESSRSGKSDGFEGGFGGSGRKPKGAKVKKKKSKNGKKGKGSKKRK